MNEEIHTPDRRGGGYLALVCFTASVGGLLFGFDTAVISGTIGPVEKQFVLSDLDVGWFGSSALIGCIAGAAAAGFLGDRFGRRPILLLSGILFFLSALFSAVPPVFGVLIAARLLGGLGVGAASVLAPMYISEFAPAALRGRLVALYQLSIVIGILLAYLSNWLIQGVSESPPPVFEGGGVIGWILVEESWRGMFAAEMVPAALFCLLLLLVPESPRWLVKEGRSRDAFEVLARVGGRESAGSQVREIEEAIAGEEGTLAELFRPGLRRALLVGVGLSFFGQLTGVNIVVYYGPTILEGAGYPVGSALQYQVAIGVVNLVATIFALWKIDAWGRRPLLVWGMALVTLWTAITGALFLAKATEGPWIVLVLCAYMGCLAFSICAVIWVLTPEIFPNRVRGRAASIATLVNWSTNAGSTFLFPWYVKKHGLDTGFFTFAAICLCATIFFWKLVPETRGRTLEEIERGWRGGGSSPEGRKAS